MTSAPEPAPPSAPQPPAVRPATLALFAVGGLLLLAIAVGAYVWASSGGDGEAAAWQGTQLPLAPALPETTLVDTSGQPFDLQAAAAGKLSVLFFGYTNCPDACPIQMATLNQALGKIDQAVQVIFVTTDPERDSPEVLRRWLDGFDRDFIGLTGSLDEIEALQAQMGVTVALREAAEDNGEYLVGHYTGAFVVPPDGRAHLAYGFGTRQEDWTVDLPRAAREPAWAGQPTERAPS